MGDAADFLSAFESGVTSSAVVLLPGYKVVTLSVLMRKSKIAILKMLPYELEDDLLGSVDDLHLL